MINRTVLELNRTETNPRNSEGAFVQLKSGRILLVYTHYYGGDEDNAAAYLASRHSDDDGETWSNADKIVIEKEGACNVMSVSLLRLADGRIALFYLVKDSCTDCRCRARLSQDEGKTWTPPVTVTGPAGYYGVNNDRVIQAHTGRLIVPSARYTNIVSDGKINFDPGGTIIYYLSDDAGKTWRPSATAHKLPQGSLQEPGVVELKDGSVYSFMRTDLGRQYHCISRDIGETWTFPEPSELHSPCSPACIKRVPVTGDLFIVWNDHSKRYGLPEPEKISLGRTPLVCAVSRDEGKTWVQRKLLETSVSNGFCYTAILFVKDRILLSYQSGGRDTAMVLDRNRVRLLDLEWVYK